MVDEDGAVVRIVVGVPVGYPVGDSVGEPVGPSVGGDVYGESVHVQVQLSLDGLVVGGGLCAKEILGSGLVIAL